MKNCDFCSIARHEISPNVVWEDDIVIAFLDFDPNSDGHTIIIPKADILDIHHLDEQSALHIMMAAKKLAGIIQKTFNYEGIEIRSVSGFCQDVPHFHLHVFGRNKNNDIEITYPEGISKDPDHLSENAEKIRRGLK